MKETAILAPQCCVYVILTKRYFIKHFYSKTECFAIQALTKPEMIGYYYETQIYKNMYLHGGRQYKEGTMAVSSFALREYAF